MVNIKKECKSVHSLQRHTFIKFVVSDIICVNLSWKLALQLVGVCKKLLLKSTKTAFHKKFRALDSVNAAIDSEATIMASFIVSTIRLRSSKLFLTNSQYLLDQSV